MCASIETFVTGKAAEGLKAWWLIVATVCRSIASTKPYIGPLRSPPRWRVMGIFPDSGESSDVSNVIPRSSSLLIWLILGYVCGFQASHFSIGKARKEMTHRRMGVESSSTCHTDEKCYSPYALLCIAQSPFNVKPAHFFSLHLESGHHKLTDLGNTTMNLKLASGFHIYISHHRGTNSKGNLLHPFSKTSGPGAVFSAMRGVSRGTSCKPLLFGSS